MAATYEPGDVVAGRWRIERSLGRGGTAEVYEADDRELGVRVALRVLAGELVGSEADEQRFRREVQLARRLTHPNVCRLFDVGIHETAGQRIPFLTMELVRGASLAALGAPLSLAFARQLAAGIDAARAAGLAHRELDPKDVIIAGERVVITDFCAPDVSAFARLLGEHGPASWRPILRQPFATCGELVAALEPRPRNFHRWAVVALACVVAGVLWFRPRAKPHPDRRVVAVLGLRNANGAADADWLSTALAEMLATELAASGRLRAAPGETVTREAAELHVATDAPDRDALARLHARVGADVVVAGRYTAEAGGLRVELRLLDAQHGATLAELSDRGAPGDLFTMVARLGRTARDRLGAGEAATHGAVPRSADAERRYAEGLALQRRFDFENARKALELAVAADPDYPLAHSALAAVLITLGDDARARTEAQRALEHAAGLPREEQLHIQALAERAAGDWRKAAETLRSLWIFYPDVPGYGLELATAQARAGQGREAYATLDAVRKLRKLPPEDPAVDVREAMVAQAVGDFPRQLAAATRASDHARAVGATGALAEAAYYQGDAAREMGQRDQAEAALAEARRAYSVLDDKGGVAYVLTAIASLHTDAADFVRAKGEQRQAVELLRESGDRLHLAWAMHNLGNIEFTAGDRSAARGYYEQTLVLFRALGDRAGTASTLCDLASTLAAQGELARAEPMFEEAVRTLHDLQRTHVEAVAAGALAELHLRKGELDLAARELEGVIARFREESQRDDLASHLALLAELDDWRGDAAGARAARAEAEKGRAQLPGDAAELASLRARAARMDGDAAAARTAADELAKAGKADAEAAARVEQAEAALAGGDLAQAQAAAARAKTLAGKTDDIDLRLAIAIAGAASGASCDDAVAALTAARDEAHAHGLLALELEAELARARLLGGAALREATSHATARGFLGLARRPGGTPRCAGRIEGER